MEVKNIYWEIKIMLVIVLVVILFWMLNSPSEKIEEEEDWRIVMVCNYDGYLINRVNQLSEDKCYGSVYDNPVIKFTLKYSMEHPIETVYEPDRKIIGKNVYCGNVYTQGTAYCLKDNSVCMVVEENICNIINMSRE